MNILNRLTNKHLLLNKRRTIVSIMGIILSTALMVGVGLLCSTIREYMIDEIKDSSGTYHTKIEEVSYDKLSLLNKNNEISNYFYESRLGYANFEDSTNEYKPYFYINQVSRNYFKELTLKEGRYPTNDSEVIIFDHINSQSGVNFELGDTITLSYGIRYFEGIPLEDESYIEGEELEVKGEKTYTIVGIASRNHFESYESPGYYVFTAAPDTLDTVNVYLTFRKTNDVESKTEFFFKNLGKETDDLSDIEYNYSLLSLYGNSGYQNFNNFIVSFLSVFLSIISVACIIVIYNSFAISVMERKKQFGLFSSIGATKTQLKKTVFYEAAVVGIIGIIIGILGAYLGIGTVLWIINMLLSEVFTLGLKLVTYPLFIIVPVIFMIIVIIVSAYLPARSASKVSPITAIRQNDDIKINKRKIKTSKFISKLFGIEGEVALKNIKRNKKKYRITIISLFISIVTFIAFSTYLEYGTRTTEDYFGTVDFDIIINYNSKSEENKEIMKDIMNHPSIDQIVEYQSFNMIIKKLDNSIFTEQYQNYLKNLNDPSDYDYITVVGMKDKYYQAYKKQLGLTEDVPILLNSFYYMDYSNDNRKAYDISIYKQNSKISHNLCSQNELIVSDEEGIYSYIDYDILTKEYIETHCTETIDNYYITEKSYFGLDQLNSKNGLIVLNEDMYEYYHNKYSENRDGTYSIGYTDTILISAKDTTELDKLGEKLSNREAYYNNITNEMRLQRNLILVIKILLYGFISLVTLIGVTSVFNTISTSIALRKKEFSILRSIGLTPHGFNKMIWFESIFFGIKSLLYAIPVGIGLSYLISLNMKELVYRESFILPINAIIISIVGVFIIVLLTMSYGARKIKKDNILDAIREENI